jgi:hypothetical protein
MSNDQPSRREFNRLSAAALAGLVAGASAGCGGSGEPTASTSVEKHLCRGLNQCKGQGASGDNACRGQGTCATVEAHSCAGQNTCKGLGGCGATAGANDCKGQGGCHVPLMDGAWETVRKRLEKNWTAAEAKFGEAPAKT